MNHLCGEPEVQVLDQELQRRDGSFRPFHGHWAFQYELPRIVEGKRRQARRMGWESPDEAGTELGHVAALLGLADGDGEVQVQVADLIQDALAAREPLPDGEEAHKRISAGVDVRAGVPTAGERLKERLGGKPGLAPGTRACCAGHIRKYLIPHLGRLRLDTLQARHAEAMFAAIEENNQRILECRASDDAKVRASVRGQRVISLPTKHRIRATWRSALSEAVCRRDLPVGVNIASHVRLPSCPRTKPMVWTPDRVRRWQADGTVPGEVMVWTPEQTRTFLTHARKYRWLHAMFHLIAAKGLRRGEAVGLPWSNTRLTDGQMDIRVQVVQLAWETVTGTPKSTPGARRLHRPWAARDAHPRWPGVSPFPGLSSHRMEGPLVWELPEDEPMGSRVGNRLGSPTSRPEDSGFYPLNEASHHQCWIGVPTGIAARSAPVEPGSLSRSSSSMSSISSMSMRENAALPRNFSNRFSKPER